MVLLRQGKATAALTTRGLLQGGSHATDHRARRRGGCMHAMRGVEQPRPHLPRLERRVRPPRQHPPPRACRALRCALMAGKHRICWAFRRNNRAREHQRQRGTAAHRRGGGGGGGCQAGAAGGAGAGRRMHGAHAWAHQRRHVCEPERGRGAPRVGYAPSPPLDTLSHHRCAACARVPPRMWLRRASVTRDLSTPPPARRSSGFEATPCLGVGVALSRLPSSAATCTHRQCVLLARCSPPCCLCPCNTQAMRRPVHTPQHLPRIACVCYTDSDAGVGGLAAASTIRMLHSQGRYWSLHSQHSTEDSMRIRHVWLYPYCSASDSRLVPRLRTRVTATACSARHNQVFTENPVTLTDRVRLAESLFNLLHGHPSTS